MKYLIHIIYMSRKLCYLFSTRIFLYNITITMYRIPTIENIFNPLILIKLSHGYHASSTNQYNCFAISKNIILFEKYRIKSIPYSEITFLLFDPIVNINFYKLLKTNLWITSATAFSSQVASVI